MPSRAIRETAPFVGYALSRQPIHPESPCPYTSHSNDDNAQDFEGHNERCDSRIMHHVVPATLEVWRVEMDATDERLSTSLSVDFSEIGTHWLTSRSALVDPRSSLLPVVVDTAAANKPKPPAHILSGYRRFSRRRHSCAENVGKGVQTVTLATLQAYRDLASDLRVRLENINEEERTDYEYDDDRAMAMGDRESTSLESVSCRIEPMSIERQPSKVDLDVLYSTPL